MCPVVVTSVLKMVLTVAVKLEFVAFQVDVGVPAAKKSKNKILFIVSFTVTYKYVFKGDLTSCQLSLAFLVEVTYIKYLTCLQL